jgi:serine/threonine protein kinase
MPGFTVLESGAEPISGYRLTRRLGCSACAEVWEAETTSGHRLAMKFLPCAAQQSAAREIRCLQVVQQLQHPHLIRIKGIWSIPGYIVVRMELAEGNLEDLLQTYRNRLGTTVPAEHACLVLADAADALDFLNARRHDIGGQRVSIPHGNVKPTNLLLVGDEVKVADAGLSRTLAARLEAATRAGTLAYCAPEMLTGKISDQTDQYGLAVIYCKLRSGRTPFGTKPSTADPASPRPEPDLSMLLEVERSTVARALRPVPQDRWPSCSEFAGRLVQALACPIPGGGPVSARRSSGLRATRKRPAAATPA